MPRGPSPLATTQTMDEMNPLPPPEISPLMHAADEAPDRVELDVREEAAIVSVIGDYDLSRGTR